MDGGLAQEQSLFAEVLAIADPVQREAFLMRACAGDARLQARMAKLLAAHARSEQFFSECGSDLLREEPGSRNTELSKSSGATGPNDTLPGQRIGNYKLLEQLGEGGCGVVYLADQLEPVHRRVALKLIKPGMDTKRVIARFEAERQALALMDHPYIAKVLDAGSTPTGRSYFVMEFVKGVKITAYCDENHLEARQRLELFIQICHAIQHAHQKGVIHRDIKPSNILVLLQDGRPLPKVIDFGIAKAVDDRLTKETTLTFQDQFIGTPAYMSPEQAAHNGLDVDTRSDIYSLGVLLYELLTGRTPFDQKDLVRSGLDEMRRRLREEDPQLPSRLLTSLTSADLTITAQQRHAEPPRLIKSLKGDLDWIVMKALEKDRQRRYETVNAMAMDVARYLNNEPVLARPPSRCYRIKKMVQRNKVAYASGLVVALSLVISLGISTRLLFREREAYRVQAQLRLKAEAAQRDAEAARANEMQLRKEAEAREKVTQASVLLSHGALKEADALLDAIPPELFSPSTEATTVFRSLGEWHMLHKRWQKAAERYAVLMIVNQVDQADLGAGATADLLSAQPLFIEAGDLEGYDRTRRMALARLGETPFPIAAEQLVKTSLLLPADGFIMVQMPALERVITNSLSHYELKQNEGSWILATWRTLSLALLDYRRGNFKISLKWLEQCSAYADQTPSCVATTHILRSMNQFQLGEVEHARAELAAGHDMVDGVFQKQLASGDNKTGKLMGWIMARILEHEADRLSVLAQMRNKSNGQRKN